MLRVGSVVWLEVEGRGRHPGILLELAAGVAQVAHVAVGTGHGTLPDGTPRDRPCVVVDPEVRPALARALRFTKATWFYADRIAAVRTSALVEAGALAPSALVLELTRLWRGPGA